MGVGRDGPSESPPGALGALGAAGSAGVIVGGGSDGIGGGSDGIGGGSGALSPLRPAGRPAWWDGVSHVVTRPGPRARHLTREIVT